MYPCPCNNRSVDPAIRSAVWRLCVCGTARSTSLCDIKAGIEMALVSKDHGRPCTKAL